MFGRDFLEIINVPLCIGISHCFGFSKNFIDFYN